MQSMQNIYRRHIKLNSTKAQIPGIGQILPYSFIIPAINSPMDLAIDDLTQHHVVGQQASVSQQ